MNFYTAKNDLSDAI